MDPQPACPGKMASPERRNSATALAWQALGATVWGIFFSIAPIVEVLVFGSLIWFPILLWREHARARRYGLLPGFPLRLGIAASIVLLALWAPVKPEYKTKIEGLPGQAVTLADLKKASGIRFRCPQTRESTSVTLPSDRPSVRDMIAAVEGQTDLRCRIDRCANSMTVLWGGYIMFVTAAAPE